MRSSRAFSTAHMIPQLPPHWAKLAAAPPTLRKPHEAITRTQGAGLPSQRPKDEETSGDAVRPVLEQCPAIRAPRKARAKAQDSKRLLVRVTSVRLRLIDEDNLCEKYVVDCCRYAGLLPGDGPATTRIQATQRKVEKGESEHTLIEIYEDAA